MDNVRCFVISAVTDGNEGKHFSQFIISTKDSPSDVMNKFVKASMDVGRHVVGDVMCTEIRRSEIETIYNQLFPERTKEHQNPVVEMVDNVVYIDFTRKKLL